MVKVPVPLVPRARAVVPVVEIPLLRPRPLGVRRAPSACVPCLRIILPFTVTPARAIIPLLLLPGPVPVPLGVVAIPPGPVVVAALVVLIIVLALHYHGGQYRDGRSAGLAVRPTQKGTNSKTLRVLSLK